MPWSKGRHSPDEAMSRVLTEDAPLQPRGYSSEPIGVPELQPRRIDNAVAPRTASCAPPSHPSAPSPATKIAAVLCCIFIALPRDSTDSLRVPHAESRGYSRLPNIRVLLLGEYAGILEDEYGSAPGFNESRNTLSPHEVSQRSWLTNSV